MLVQRAYRILRQRDASGIMFNPLEDLLEKIKAHGKYRASFELGHGRLFEDEIPIYDPATDRKRLYGGPCLSHLSIKVDEGVGSRSSANPGITSRPCPFATA